MRSALICIGLITGLFVVYIHDFDSSFFPAEAMVSCGIGGVAGMLLVGPLTKFSQRRGYFFCSIPGMPNGLTPAKLLQVHGWFSMGFCVSIVLLSMTHWPLGMIVGIVAGAWSWRVQSIWASCQEPSNGSGSDQMGQTSLERKPSNGSGLLDE